MFQTYQKFLKETSSKIFLKYDGERTEEKYTVVLYDLKDSDLTISKETDNLSDDFLELMKRKGFLVPLEEFEYLLENFLDLRDSLMEKYGDKIVFGFIMVNRDEKLEYSIFFHYEEIREVFSNFNFNEILKFVDSL